jgi:hypothetical protein
MYAPVRFHMGQGRGANTSGSLSGSTTTAGAEYPAKRETMMKGSKGSRHG